MLRAKGEVVWGLGVDFQPKTQSQLRLLNFSILVHIAVAQKNLPKLIKVHPSDAGLRKQKITCQQASQWWSHPFMPPCPHSMSTKLRGHPAFWERLPEDRPPGRTPSLHPTKHCQGLVFCRQVQLSCPFRPENVCSYITYLQFVQKACFFCSHNKDILPQSRGLSPEFSLH